MGYRRGRGPELVVVLDRVGCRAAHRTVLDCCVEELKPLRELTSGGTGASVCKEQKEQDVHHNRGSSLGEPDAA
jgi:hypothetical protein